MNETLRRANPRRKGGPFPANRGNVWIGQCPAGNRAGGAREDNQAFAPAMISPNKSQVLPVQRIN
jgi:hypothetical protein